MSSAVNVNETDGNFQNKVLNAVKFLTVLILSLTLSIYAPFSLAKEKGEERAQEIRQEKERHEEDPEKISKTAHTITIQDKKHNYSAVAGAETERLIFPLEK